jgi:hypothetical protein
VAIRWAGELGGLWRFWLALGLVAAVGWPGGVLTAGARQAAPAGSIAGTVTEAETGRPVAGAVATIDQLGLSAVTGATGQFAWPDILLPGDVVTVTVRVTAAGWGAWVLRDVRVLAQDRLLLAAALERGPVTLTAPPPRDRLPLPPEPPTVLPDIAAVRSGQPLPATIRVRVTGVATCSLTRPYTVVEVDFRDYVKHVLPNEWIASWKAEALRSGAMAAKMYAWYWIARGGKWPDADVYDSTCDQVYNPAIAYASTNAAVDETWNWRLTRGGLLFPTAYRAYAHQCAAAGLTGSCLGQWDSQWLAQARTTWPDILAAFYQGSALSPIFPFERNLALRFEGAESGAGGHLVVPVAAKPGAPEPPADVGATDFTLEFWLRADPGTMPEAPVACGVGQGWQDGVLLVDRELRGLDRHYGLALAGGRLAFGVAGDGAGAYTLCGPSLVVDGAWHHVAAARRRSDGYLWLWVDGRLEAAVDGPDGDISHPNDALSSTGTCAIEPLACDDQSLVIGSGKPVTATRPGFAGWMDEIRISNTIRYSASFEPGGYLAADAATVVLYHLDDPLAAQPCAGVVVDSSGAAGGPSHGQCRRSSAGLDPQWVGASRPGWVYQLFVPWAGR